MKLRRRLLIGNTEYPVIEERVLLQLNTAGKAQFVIDSQGASINPFDVVSFDLGYTQHFEYSRLFLGYIDRVVKAGPRKVKLFCRELSGILSAPMPLELRLPTLNDVLTSMHSYLQLNFAIPDQSYSTTKVPHFKNLGDGYQALSTVGRVFRIQDFIWQQKNNGVVYVGSWADSRWPDRGVQFPERLFKEHLSSQSAEIAAVPGLMPGAVMNGRRLSRVEFSGNSMAVTWL